jgi:hypothetical protein
VEYTKKGDPGQREWISLFANEKSLSEDNQTTDEELLKDVVAEGQTVNNNPKTTGGPTLPGESLTTT